MSNESENKNETHACPICETSYEIMPNGFPEIHFHNGIDTRRQKACSICESCFEDHEVQLYFISWAELESMRELLNGLGEFLNEKLRAFVDDQTFDQIHKEISKFY